MENREWRRKERKEGREHEINLEFYLRLLVSKSD